MMRLLFLFHLFLFSCSAQVKETGGDYYNLAFSESRKVNDFRWTFESVGDEPSWCLNWRKDTELNRSVCCLEEGKSLKGERQPLRVVMEQQFPLFRSFGEAEVQLNAKVEHLGESWLKVFSLDASETCLRRDSVRIGGTGWNTYRLDIPLQGVHYLWVSLSGRERPGEKHPGARLLLDSMDIRLDGHSVNDVSGKSASSAPELDQSLICPLSFAADSLIGHIPLFNDHFRVIGLGEMMHGSLSFGKVKNQVIRWLVENRQCKLVMVEMLGIIALKWDLYAQGFPVSLDEIMEDLAGTGCVRKDVAELLGFLREYNRTASRKVHVVGIDRTPGIWYTPLMFDYLYALYQRKPEDCLYRLVRNYVRPDSVYALLTGFEEKLTNNMGDFEYAWFRTVYGLKVSENGYPGVREHGVMNRRDSIMWLHAKRALVKLQEDECAVVTGHWCHLNKGNGCMYFYPSLGHYLAEYYGRDYRSVALMGGVGTVCALSIEQLRFDSACVLPPPSEDMIEWRAMETGIPYFYYPTDRLAQLPVRFGCIPLLYEKRRTEACNLSERVDGFIFVRDCESAAIPRRHSRIDSYHADKVFSRRLKRMCECGNKMGFDFSEP